MVLRETPETLIGRIGHDGSEIIDPDATEPQGRRGFHIQEFVPIVFNKGLTLTPFELSPTRLVNGKVVNSSIQDTIKRIKQARGRVSRSKGVIIGRTLRGQHHAVAFENGLIYDPDGWVYEFSLSACTDQHKFFPQTIWFLYPGLVEVTP